MQPWSISALEAFELCPKQYWATRVGKTVATPESEAMRWGKQVHTAFEHYIRDGREFPMGMGNMQEIADEVLAAYSRPRVKQAGVRHVEVKYALREDLQATEYFAKDVWLRVVADFVYIAGSTAVAVDWKTGKRKSGDDQLALTALGVMHCNPEVDAVLAAYCWLQEPKGQRMDVQSYSRGEVQRLWNRFLPRVERFQEAFRKDEFPAKPNGLCRRHCPVKTCPHNGG
jgi:hypothetical protein